MSAPPPMSTTARIRLADHAMLRVDKVTGETMLLFPEGALKLNPTGAAIVGLCDGRSVDEMVQELASKYSAPKETLHPQVEQYLARLQEKGLLRIEEP